jgi:predicted amidohydrolase YtcJ
VQLHGKVDDISTSTSMTHSERESSGTIFQSGRLFVSQKDGNDALCFQSCMLVQDGLIKHVGSEDDSIIVKSKENGAAVEDLAGKVVLPGFIDGHMHLLLFGQSLQKLDLSNCRSLEDIRSLIKSFAQQHPSAPRILCRSWMHSMTDGLALASMIDDLDDRPIFIDSKDLHSVWCNTAALKELGDVITTDTPGAVIQRDEHGIATGLLSESIVFNTIWPHLANYASIEQKLDAIRLAITKYNEAGYTGMIDMAMDENGWEALLELRSREAINMRIAAYWLITPSDEESCLKQVDRAIEMSHSYNAETQPDLHIVGIKLICDGVIDGCTAALLEPYSSGEASPGLLWEKSTLAAVSKRANSAGLQCAFHAIGDLAVKVAIDTIEATCKRDLRPRIEHLELTTEKDAKRLGQFGITASIQPVHADPAILRAWPKLLGDHRHCRAFAYQDFAAGGAPLAIGSDAPTAPNAPFMNLYTATTRRSAREVDLTTTVNENFALSLCQAITAATHGAARSCFADLRTGSLENGKLADFVVVDSDLLPSNLLKAKVCQTWIGGRKIFDSSS